VNLELVVNHLPIYFHLNVKNVETYLSLKFTQANGFSFKVIGMCRLSIKKVPKKFVVKFYGPMVWVHVSLKRILGQISLAVIIFLFESYLFHFWVI
jgi:hypothetical protein